MDSSHLCLHVRLDTRQQSLSMACLYHRQAQHNDCSRCLNANIWHQTQYCHRRWSSKSEPLHKAWSSDDLWAQNFPATLTAAVGGSALTKLPATSTGAAYDLLASRAMLTCTESCSERNTCIYCGGTRCWLLHLMAAKRQTKSSMDDKAYNSTYNISWRLVVQKKQHLQQEGISD